MLIARPSFFMWKLLATENTSSTFPSHKLKYCFNFPRTKSCSNYSAICLQNVCFPIIFRICLCKVSNVAASTYDISVIECQLSQPQNVTTQKLTILYNHYAKISVYIFSFCLYIAENNRMRRKSTEPVTATSDNVVVSEVFCV